ncbi:30S ribosomal protein S4 [Candidatus Woesearchaeota archaeon]|nr:30S ribosomal protein S4 [Candidatus Woesearchaeota archaeon]
MGDPSKLRKKYSKPSHPWQKLRIEEEKVLLKEYGFKNKTELWVLNSKLRDFKKQVKDLVPRRDEQAEKEKRQLLTKLQSLNLIGKDAILEDILALELKDICERRLQTIVFRKGLAKSIRQSRQFIVHEHITVGNHVITSPSYLISTKEEPLVSFANNALFNNEDHPERQKMTQTAEVKNE